MEAPREEDSILAEFAMLVSKTKAQFRWSVSKIKPKSLYDKNERMPPFTSRSEGISVETMLLRLKRTLKRIELQNIDSMSTIRMTPGG